MLYNAVKSYFYPRSPCGERLFALLCNLLHHDFYPRSPCGERLFVVLSLRGDYVFLSTLSLRRATIISQANGCATIPFLSTLSLRRATVTEPLILLRAVISIHALLAESDGLKVIVFFTTQIFLSTLSLRRATLNQSHTSSESIYFYPRSPCGERPFIIPERSQ